MAKGPTRSGRYCNEPDPRPPGAADGAGGRDRRHTFTAQLWRWEARRKDNWTFVTLPTDISTAIEDEAATRGPRAGFGAVKVRARIDACTWQTSVFPDVESGCFVLPIKRLVRQSTGIEAGDFVTIHVHSL